MSDNPGQIAQSTAIQTLDQLLHHNWIYESTFTASTTMPAGTVLFVKPIHPLEWNWPNKRVASMFNLWTGSGKIRYRPLATAWYGGSIRVGFLPPNMKMSEVQNMPLEVLTSYPNRDIDPKNTAWVDFRGPDQRDVAYHYMEPFNDQDKRNFGGYIVFYVAGKLVTQAPEFTTIQFIVELSGDFMYDQPGPKALTSAAITEHPLGLASDIPLHLQPMVDNMHSGSSMKVQVVPVSQTSVTAGGLLMASVGVPRSFKVGAPAISGLFCAESIKEEFNTRTVGNSLPDLLFAAGARNVRSDIGIPPFSAQQGSALIGVGTLTIPEGIQNAILNQWNNSPAPGTPGYVSMGPQTPITPGNTALMLQGANDRFCIAPNTTNPTVTPTVNTLTSAEHMSIAPQAAGESIVVFSMHWVREFSVQTSLMAQQMGKWPQDMSSSDISWLYQLVNANGTPLITLRLNPNGVLTTNAASVPVVYPAINLYLRYFGTLPLSSPLPPLTYQASQLRRILVRTQRDGGEDCMEKLSFEVDLA
jgi:hypothetical protein